MDSIKLRDGYTLSVEDGASISCIVHIAEDELYAVDALAHLTRENVEHVEFWSEGEEAPYGVYNNMILIAQPIRQAEEVGGALTGRVIITFGLREQTEVEHRLALLEDMQNIQSRAINNLNETQALQDGAIEDLGEIVSELYPEEEEE